MNIVKRTVIERDMRKGSCARIVASRLLQPMLGCWMVLAASREAQAGAPWRRLPSGLEIRAVDAVPSLELPVQAWLIRLDPSLHELRALAAPLDGTHAPLPQMASLVAEGTNALAVVNASYFDEKGRPLGLLITGGKTVLPANRKGWGWAAVIRGRLAVRQATAAIPAGVSEAVQAGPLLVSNGKARVLRSESAARRAFVGADSAGRIVLGATNGPVTLGVLATLLARSEAGGGAGLVDALNLDGGSSAQLHVAGEDPELKVAGVPVPVFLGVFPLGK